MRSLRTKLFLIITGVVAIPVVVLSVIVPAGQVRSLEDTLDAKAASFARIGGEQTRSALSYDDVATVRESFAGAALDGDVTFLALYRPDGELLYAQGESRGPPPPPSANVIVDRRADRVRAHVGVTSAGRHHGVIVVELSTARVAAIAAGLRSQAARVGIAALLVACVAAWLIAHRVALRIGRVATRARRIAAGELSAPAPVDGAADEIGQLAASFDAVVGNLRGLVHEIDEVAGMIDSSTGALLDLAREQQRHDACSARGNSAVLSVLELGAYATQLRGAVERFHADAPAAAPPYATPASSAEHAAVSTAN